jgi:photosystem II stability/assembly factor-like uncharacterized protein
MEDSHVIPATLIRAALLTAGLATALAVSGDDASELDIDYAEKLPLVPHSMLLDVTRAGDTLVAVGERGHVILSADGSDWQQAEVVPTRATLTTVFGLGGRLWAGGHDAVIITSGDGGNTWTREFFDPDRQQAVMDIYFTDLQNGVAIGSYGLYLRTDDGGQTWEEVTIDEEGGYHLNAMVRFEDGRRLIAGEAGYSYRSYDDGETWELMDMPYLGSMWGALQLDEECALFYGLRGNALKSCDFGTTWLELDTGTEASISGSALNDGQVLLVANSGMLLVKDDSNGFLAEKHSSGVDFAAAVALDDGSFVLVGEDGVFRYPETAQQGASDE